MYMSQKKLNGVTILSIEHKTAILCSILKADNPFSFCCELLRYNYIILKMTIPLSLK